MDAESTGLTDAELSAARLEIDDPLSMPNLCRDKPPAELAPEIVGEYHLPPGTDFIWCCHCQGHHHRNGFVITNSTRQHYLLGSDCGPKHYDLSFKLARRHHQLKVRRRGILDRLHAIVATAPEVNATIQEALHSEALRLVNAKREELRRASESAYSSLATSVATGMPLNEFVRVRDIAAEQQRDAQLPGDETGPPIYKTEPHSLGRVAGGAMLRDRGDCRDQLLALRGSIDRVLAVHREITDNFSVPQLTKAVREAEQAWEAARDAINEVELSDAFFTEGNLNRLERWSAESRYFKLIADGQRLIVTNQAGKQTMIEPLPPISLPDLPRFREA
jgi:hypothetical protein